MKTLIMLFVLFSIYILPQKIELLGPPWGININTMKLHTQNSDYLYSTESANASCFRTTNGGETNEWIDLQNENVPIWVVGSDGKKPNTFYLAISQTGYFKTIDGGENWSSILNSSLNGYYYDLVVNPLDPNSLLVIHKGNEIWKSYDGGESWFQLAIFNTFELTQLEISYQDTSVLFATGVNSLYKSIDAVSI